MVAFTDPNGKSGIVHVIAVAEHLLNPVGSEFSATFVGRLVTTLIQQMGSRLGDQLDMLLKAVLSKLQGAQTLTVAQSLIMVYAHLVHSQLEAVLAFLSSVPGPTGASALQFVLGEWVDKQQQFFGCYVSKVFAPFTRGLSSSCTLLAFIFLSAIGSHRPLVQAFLICRVAFTFFSSYTCKVSITAVAKLLRHGVNTNDSRLTEITVRGDQVFFKI